MSMPAQPPPVTWQVTGSTETTEVTTGGNVVKGRTVYFKTGTNAEGSLFIPDNVTDTGVMRAMIQQKAEQITAMDSLTSGS